MRLRKSRNAAEEEIMLLINTGYQILNFLRTDYLQKRPNPSFNPKLALQDYRTAVSEWKKQVILILKSVFPTELEANQFSYPKASFSTAPAQAVSIQNETEDDFSIQGLHENLDNSLRELDVICNTSLLRYTDLPITARLYVEDIDSFAKVRDINPDKVSSLLKPGGYFDYPEDFIQIGLEKILNEPFHKKDWGGEYNDLYTSNLIINGARRATAFLLKGNGLQVNNMEIKNCGKNGDQILRLFDSPAEFFVIQFVGNISEAVIKDADGKVEQLRAKGKQVCYCIMNGLDTARLLYAYSLV